MEKSTRDHITETHRLIEQTAQEVERLREMKPTDKLQIARLKVFLEQQREMLEGFEDLYSPGPNTSAQ